MGVAGISRSPLVDRFELRERLGEGGMAVVYRAWDRTLGKEVALKRMHEIGAMQAHRLKAEFRARSALQHRSLVQLFELVIDGDDCFFTMELVEGTDLESWVRHGASGPPRVTSEGSPVVSEPRTATTVEGPERAGEPRSSGRAASHGRRPTLDSAALARLRAALSELCVGLSLLHDAAIVHRDVKPANVRVTPSGRVVLSISGSRQARRWGSPISRTPERPGTWLPSKSAPRGQRRRPISMPSVASSTSSWWATPRSADRCARTR